MSSIEKFYPNLNEFPYLRDIRDDDMKYVLLGWDRNPLANNVLYHLHYGSPDPEVRSSATISYKSYPAYKDDSWSIVQEDKLAAEDYGRRYILKYENGQYSLTADIMNGWHEILKKLFNWKKSWADLIMYEKKNEEHPLSRNTILTIDCEGIFALLEKQCGSRPLASVFLSFLSIAYTIGNCIPLDHNKGGNGGDSWDNKLDKIIGNIRKKKKTEKSIGGVCLYDIYKDDSSLIKYITDHYLLDYIRTGDFPDSEFEVRSICNPDDPSIKSYAIPENKEELIAYITTLCKLIIQRGYRIEKQFTGKWTKERAIEVRQAFKAVGLPKDDDIKPDENGLKYSIIGEWEE